MTLGVLTGTAAPVARRAGDEVPAGAVPVSGPLHVVALREARESTLERLAELSRSLKDRPTRLQRLADPFAGGARARVDDPGPRHAGLHRACAPRSTAP